MLPSTKTSRSSPLSIVVICRDNLQELRDTLGSIREQGSDRVQTIVVDGSVLSQDCTLAAGGDSVVHDVLSGPDKGIYDAMNKGINASKGEVLLFMNSGDRFADGFCLDKFLEEHLETGRRTIIAGQAIFRVANRRFICSDIPPVHQAMFFPLEAILRSGLYRTDLRVAGDVEFINRISASVGVTFVNDNICEFQLGGLSTAPRTVQHVLMLYRDAKAVGRITSTRAKINFLIRQFAKMVAVKCLGFERAFLLTASLKTSWTELDERAAASSRCARAWQAAE